MLISFKWAAVKWRFIVEATQKGSQVEEESETGLLAYLGFKALNKKEADPLWSCVGKHKTSLSFCCCCRKQILWNSQKVILFFSKRNCAALFSECLQMPEARLQGSCWQWWSQLPQLVPHLQVLAAGLLCRATCTSTQASRWLPWVNDISGTVCALPAGGRMVCVLILIDDLKTYGAGRVGCDVAPRVYKNSLSFVSVDAGPDPLKLYVYSQSMNVISWFTLFKLFRYLKWNTSVSVCNTFTRVLLALSSWNWCTGWCVLSSVIVLYSLVYDCMPLQAEILTGAAAPSAGEAGHKPCSSTCGTEVWARWSWQLLPSTHHQPHGVFYMAPCFMFFTCSC